MSEIPIKCRHPVESALLQRRAPMPGSHGRDEEKLSGSFRRESGGELEPELLPENLIVPLGLVTENLNRLWYSAPAGRTIEMRQQPAPDPLCWVDGGPPLMPHRRQRRGFRGQVHAGRGRFGEGSRREAHGPAAAQYVGDQRQFAALSITPGAGTWLTLHTAIRSTSNLLRPAEQEKKMFWRCVET